MTPAYRHYAARRLADGEPAWKVRLDLARGLTRREYGEALRLERESMAIFHAIVLTPDEWKVSP